MEHSRNPRHFKRSGLIDRLLDRLLRVEISSFPRMLCPIEEHWLPILAPKHCLLSEPLDTPPPEYDPSQDCLLVWQNATYGPLAWEITKSQLKAPPHWKDRFNWFAKALLEGQVRGALHSFWWHEFLVGFAALVLIECNRYSSGP